MRHELALLTGQTTDAEYFAQVDAASRGLRFPVARPGWSNRWRRVLEGVGSFLVYVALVIGVPAAIWIFGIANDLDVGTR
jgi:hypothetical protein